MVIIRSHFGPRLMLLPQLAPCCPWFSEGAKPAGVCLGTPAAGRARNGDGRNYQGVQRSDRRQ
eukprot:10979829-Lingulodinium_polyedra.AAC.1